MKTYKRLLIIYFCTLVLFSNFFMCYTMPVLASDGVYDPDTSWWDKFVDESTAYIVYLACRVGAIVKDYDFAKWVQAREDYKEWWNTGHISRLESSDGNINYTFDEELMTYIKQCLDDYAAENQPFKLEKTYKASLIPASRFCSKVEYEHFLSYFDSDSYNYVVFRIGSAGYNFLQDITPVIKDGGGFVHYRTTNVFNMYRVYDSDWKHYTTPLDLYIVKEDENGDSYIEYSETKGGLDGIQYFVNHSVSFYDRTSLATPDGGTIRVYNTVADYINYSVGQRKIYYTSEYYNYVPEDLQVSIDDLQKTIDGMQSVIDKLLDQITNNTSESEIEELLRQILEELKNNQGGSSGGDGSGGSGGGDVNVDIDLGATNSWLSKIYAKVSQIFEKMNAAVEDAEQSALAKIQESLDEIIVQLKKIKHWTVAGTVIDAADAVADWADLLLGILKDAKEGAGSAVAAIATTVGDSVDLMAQKFPFSVPWDILFFVSVLSSEPKMPYFEIPFNVELSMLDIRIDYTMKLDFSQLQWFSDLSRLLLSMTYAVGLLKMTAGITSVGKEE